MWGVLPCVQAGPRTSVVGGQGLQLQQCFTPMPQTLMLHYRAPHLHAAALPSSSASLIKHTGAVAVAERNNSYSALVHMWHATTTPVGQTGKAKDARLYKASAGISARARTSLCGRGGTWSVCVRSVSVSHTWQVKMRALAPHRARCSHSRRGLASPRGTQPAPGCVSRRSSSGGSS